MAFSQEAQGHTPDPAQAAEALAAQMRFCFLFTDLASPTANKIYQQIGYVRVGEALELRLTPAR